MNSELTAYCGYLLRVTDERIHVRTPDGRRLGSCRSMSSVRRLIRAHRREVRVFG